MRHVLIIRHSNCSCHSFHSGSVIQIDTTILTETYFTYIIVTTPFRVASDKIYLLFVDSHDSWQYCIVLYSMYVMDEKHVFLNDYDRAQTKIPRRMILILIDPALDGTYGTKYCTHGQWRHKAYDVLSTDVLSRQSTVLYVVVVIYEKNANFI